MIGLFGGSFDPIHFGHLNLGVELKEKCDLKEVWFIPTYASPLKEKPQIEGVRREEMIRLALKGIDGFKVVDHEVRNENSSYTIDTVTALIQLFPSQKFTLILGEDAALQLPSWKEPEKLIQLLPLLVGARSRVKLKEKIENKHFSPSLEAAIVAGIHETNLFDISGTEIRKRLKNKLYCGHLVPAKVLDYIYENQLYFNA
jgi:nicotinate-nucleotide adenylyltransferase